MEIFYDSLIFTSQIFCSSFPAHDCGTCSRLLFLAHSFIFVLAEGEAEADRAENVEATARGMSERALDNLFSKSRVTAVVPAD